MAGGSGLRAASGTQEPRVYRRIDTICELGNTYSVRDPLRQTSREHIQIHGYCHLYHLCPSSLDEPTEKPRSYSTALIHRDPFSFTTSIQASNNSAQRTRNTICHLYGVQTTYRPEQSINTPLATPVNGLFAPSRFIITAGFYYTTGDGRY